MLSPRILARRPCPPFSHTVAFWQLPLFLLTTPRSRYARKKARAGPGGQKGLTEGNIGDWKLLKKMEIKEREKSEAVTSRAKAKTKRVTSTKTGAGGAVSASGAAQVV